MTTFTIDADHNITAYANAGEAKQGDAAGVIQFDSQAALAKLSADWPLSRFVEIWNGIPGQTPVKKFQDRNKAVARLWKAVQSWAGQGQSESAAEKVQPKPPSPAKPVQAAKKAARKTKGRNRLATDAAAHGRNKKAEVIAMLKRPKGATLAEIMEATHWQQHTVRGFVSLLGSQAGLAIESSKNAAGERTYKLCGAPHNLY